MQVVNFTPIRTNLCTCNNNKQKVSYTSPAFKGDEYSSEDILLDILKIMEPPPPPKPYEEMLQGISELKIPIEDKKRGALSLKKLNNFSIDEYKRLSQTDLDNINLLANEFIYNRPCVNFDRTFNKKLQYHDIMANGIKKKFDSMYGEGNYVVIPIGRSLSSVGKCLGYKIGEDNVKPLPLSRAGKYLDLEECADEDFDSLNKYLKSVGLSKKEVEKSDKQYIFIDYCSSGRSLIGARNLFKSDKVYGNLSNVRFMNAMHVLKKTELDDPKDLFFFESKNIYEDLERMFNYSHFKKYSLVDHCFKLNNMKEGFVKPEYRNLESRIFLYKLLDNEMKKSS